MLKRILVGLGGTAYTPFAIERAIELARQHQAESTGVTVVDFRRLSRAERRAGRRALCLDGSKLRVSCLARRGGESGKKM